MKWSNRQNRDLSFFQKREICIIRNAGTHTLLLVGCNFIVHFKKANKHMIEAAESPVNVAGAGHPLDRGKRHFSQRLFGDHRCNF